MCVLPLFHIYALSGIMLGAVRNGNQLILYPRPDIDLIVKDLAGKKPTFLPGVPTLYTAIKKHPKAKGLDLQARSRSACRAARHCRSRCSSHSRSSPARP